MAVDIVCGKELDIDAMNATVGHIPAGAPETDPAAGTKRLAVRAWLLNTKTLPPPVRLLNATRSWAIAEIGTSQNDVTNSAAITLRTCHITFNLKL